MLEHLKKYWFLILIVIILVVGTITFSKQQIDSTFKGKKVNGKDIVFALDKEYVNADEYYEGLLPTDGGKELYRLFERYVLTEMETSDEIKKQSAEYAKNQVDNTSAQGSKALGELKDAIAASGYTNGLKDLKTLYENQAKLVLIEREYIKNNKAETAEPYMEDAKPRIVSHILIKMADAENPTEAESKKLADAQAALEKGDAFGDVALKFSDDTNSATQKGSLGYIDSASNLEAVFIKAASEVDAGETTEWFNGKNGKHIVLVEKTSFEDLIEEDNFVTSVANKYQEVQKESVLLASKDFEITFNDEETEKLLNDFIKGGN